ncbi:hypothetical protein MRX96_023106 [Rhipicephalus microplus]
MCWTTEPTLSSVVNYHRLHGFHPGRRQSRVGFGGDTQGRKTTVPRVTLQRGPAAQLRGGDAVPVPAVIEKMTFTSRGMEACLSLTNGLGPCRKTAAVRSPYPASSGWGHYA